MIRAAMWNLSRASCWKKQRTHLYDAGAQVDHEARPAFTLEKAVDTFSALLQAALAGGVSNDQLDDYASTSGDTPAARTRRFLAMRHRQWLSYNERRLQMRKAWEEFFAQLGRDPAAGYALPAIPHDHSEPMASRTVSVGGEQRPYWDLTAWMAPAGACYLPVTVVPVGCLSNGLPVGIQIVGPYLGDRTTLDIGNISYSRRRMSTTRRFLNRRTITILSTLCQLRTLRAPKDQVCHQLSDTHKI